MANPTTYTPGYDFSDYQAAAPTAPLPGDQVDNELDTIATVLTNHQAAIMDIRRSDGTLKNGIVTRDSLAGDIFIGIEVPTTWLTGTEYAVGDTAIVTTGAQGLYRCLVAHTSGVDFSGDLNLERWELLFSFVVDTLNDEAVAAAYANVVPQISAGEKTAGTETDLRTFSPKDVADMAAAAAAAASGAVSSVNGATGAVTITAAGIGAATSGHTHSDATTSVAGFMSAADKTKLDGVEAGAEVNPPSQTGATWNAGASATESTISPSKLAGAIAALAATGVSPAVLKADTSVASPGGNQSVTSTGWTSIASRSFTNTTANSKVLVFGCVQFYHTGGSSSITRGTSMTLRVYKDGSYMSSAGELDVYGATGGVVNSYFFCFVSDNVGAAGAKTWEVRAQAGGLGSTVVPPDRNMYLMEIA